jgi:hypothetical protein
VIRLRNITIALTVLCALAAAAPPAFALDGNWKHVVRECYNTGRLDGSKYTRGALRTAKKKLPADIREYSDCEDLINEALAARRHRGDGGGGGGAPPPPPGQAGTTPSGATGNKRDVDALERETDPKTRSNVPPQVQVGNRKLSPTTSGLLSAKRTDANSLPLPLILSLAGLALMAALGTVAVLRQHWPKVRRAPLRLLRR